MPEREEVVGSVFGAYLLARMDHSGMTHFNITVDGFWNSFFAAVIVAPGYAVMVAQKLMERPETVDLGWVVIIHGAAYVGGWAAFPLAALLLTPLLGVSHNYVAMIVAANWAAVIQVGIFLAALLLSLILPGFLGGVVLTVATVAILFYQWFVLRTALDTTGGIALALLLVDLVLNSLINLSADRMLF